MKQKNLLFVFADQWRRMAMGAAGQDPVKTPRMDDFAKQGTFCSNAISSFPLCSPHRACLFTGKWPHSTGMYTNCKPGIDVRLKDSEVCVAEVMRDAGYQTAYIGKWHLDEPEINKTEEPLSGARNWDAYTPPGIRRHGFDFWYAYNTYDMHLTPHYWKDSPDMIKVNKWSPENETDVAIDYLRNRKKNNPFAMFVSWNPPHSPYNLVPQKYLDIYKDEELPLRGNVNGSSFGHHTPGAPEMSLEELKTTTKEYFAAVSGLDEQFGRLLDELKAQGLEEDTIVVLTSDHGDMMGSHGLMGKHVWYEESVGIPFLIGGADIPKGRCESVFGSADVAPTLLNLLNLPIPKQMEGKSVAADICEGAGKNESFTYLYACPGSLELTAELEKAGLNPREMGWRGIRSQSFTYIVDVGYTPNRYMKRILYNLEEDPLQMNPQVIESAGENPHAAKMEAGLKSWLKQQGDNFLKWF